MKFQVIILLSIILFAACTASKNSQSAKNKYFIIEIEQDGKTIKPKNNIIKLKKKPFKFKFQLIKTDHVYASASWGKYYYDYPDDKNIFHCEEEKGGSWDYMFEKCRFVAIKTGVEDKFNEAKDIYVGKDGKYQSVWFYDKNKDWHRFDKNVKVENGITYASITVENILDLAGRDDGAENYEFKVKDIKKDIYVVLATSLYENRNTSELQREKFILKF